MYLVKPKVEIISEIDRNKVLQKIENVGRVAYKSEDKITADSAPRFVKMLLGRNHLAVLEHESITVKITTNRGVSHELVRHRIASYCQESTRYCNYGKANSITICIPSYMKDLITEEGEYGFTMSNTDGYLKKIEDGLLIKIDKYEGDMAFGRGVTDLPVWAKWQINGWQEAEYSYLNMIKEGCTPQQARGVLPNDLKTEIMCTMNLREWIHFLNLRSKGTTGAPHPDMKQVADMIYKQFVEILPEVFVGCGDDKVFDAPTVIEEEDA